MRARIKKGNSDPNNARVSLLQLLKENSRYGPICSFLLGAKFNQFFVCHLINRYTRAVCHLLLVDYVCLPSYPLPPDCQFLNRSRATAMEALSKGVMIPAMRSSPS